MVLFEIVHRVSGMIPDIRGMISYLAAAGFASFVWAGFRRRHRFTELMQVGGICACSVGTVAALRSMVMPASPELVLRTLGALALVRFR
jgi:hypothetical protein